MNPSTPAHSPVISALEFVYPDKQYALIGTKVEHIVDASTDPDVATSAQLNTLLWFSSDDMPTLADIEVALKLHEIETARKQSIEQRDWAGFEKDINADDELMDKLMDLSGNVLSILFRMIDLQISEPTEHVDAIVKQLARIRTRLAVDFTKAEVERIRQYAHARHLPELI